MARTKGAKDKKPRKRRGLKTLTNIAAGVAGTGALVYGAKRLVPKFRIGKKAKDVGAEVVEREMGKGSAWDREMNKKTKEQINNLRRESNKAWEKFAKDWNESNLKIRKEIKSKKTAERRKQWLEGQRKKKRRKEVKERGNKPMRVLSADQQRDARISGKIDRKIGFGPSSTRKTTNYERYLESKGGYERGYGARDVVVPENTRKQKARDMRGLNAPKREKVGLRQRRVKYTTPKDRAFSAVRSIALFNGFKGLSTLESYAEFARTKGAKDKKKRKSKARKLLAGALIGAGLGLYASRQMKAMKRLNKAADGMENAAKQRRKQQEEDFKREVEEYLKSKHF